VHRRALLAAAAAGLAGCAGLPTGETVTPTRTDVEALPLAEQGYPPTVCDSDPVDVGIPAIVDPAFAPDWSGVDVDERYADAGTLADDHVVVGVAAGGATRAYPLGVLTPHEVVNDVLPDGTPLLVTYCPLCDSGMVAERRVGGESTAFIVSGQLWTPPELSTRAAAADNRSFALRPDDPDPGAVRNTGNLLLLDRATGSYWSQLLARAICGPERGTELSVLPATTARWGVWRREHPETGVLLPPPHSGVV
jgi:hypothetical protein